MFSKYYHDLKFTQKLRAVQTSYHITDAVVLLENIAYVLNRFFMAAIAKKGHVNQLMEALSHLTGTTKILRKFIKKFASTNASLMKQNQEK